MDRGRRHHDVGEKVEALVQGVVERAADSRHEGETVSKG